MRFYEFECKLLLAKMGVPLPHGGTASTPEQARQLATELNAPGVLKSQVLSGGRMKAGGVKLADTPEEPTNTAAQILKLPSRDQLPRCAPRQAKAALAKEYS